ncbi:GntR family transcriptional regulator [Embleya scabrispora]|uniref:GntR family transcriptional regulator n=1 Tax=Embleya scabrispora TaxID=159449 RepID=UPI00131A1661|nr:GntR family transcriptional regulator [Embleya scabrispora]MYS87628.1 GntR family transcriptional regulator [Streptomyces sp. SID5474]
MTPSLTARTKSRTALAREAIRGRILRLEMAPGTVFSEGDLATALGMGKTPVREALNLLIHESLVAVAPHSGYLVMPVTLRDIRELLELRLTVETLAARLAAGRRDAEGLRGLDEAARAWRRTAMGGASTAGRASGPGHGSGPGPAHGSGSAPGSALARVAGSVPDPAHGSVPGLPPGSALGSASGAALRPAGAGVRTRAGVASVPLGWLGFGAALAERAGNGRAVEIEEYVLRHQLRHLCLAVALGEPTWPAPDHGPLSAALAAGDQDAAAAAVEYGIRALGAAVFGALVPPVAAHLGRTHGNGCDADLPADLLDLDLGTLLRAAAT